MKSQFPWSIAMGFMAAGMIIGWLFGCALLQTRTATIRVGMKTTDHTRQVLMKTERDEIITIVVSDDSGFELGTEPWLDRMNKNAIHFGRWWKISEAGDTVTRMGAD